MPCASFANIARAPSKRVGRVLGGGIAPFGGRPPVVAAARGFPRQFPMASQRQRECAEALTRNSTRTGFGEGQDRILDRDNRFSAATGVQSAREERPVLAPRAIPALRVVIALGLVGALTSCGSQSSSPTSVTNPTVTVSSVS